MKSLRVRIAIFISLLVGMCSFGCFLEAETSQSAQDQGKQVVSEVSKEALDRVQQVLGKKIRDALAKEGDIDISELIAKMQVLGFPGVDNLPDSVRKIFGNMVVTDPKVRFDEVGIIISGTMIVAGKANRIMLRIAKKKGGGYGFAVFFNFTQDLKISDLAPKGTATKVIKKMEFLKIKEGTLFLSTMQYEEPEFGEIGGFGLIGQLGYFGWGQTINRMFGGIPQKLQARIKGLLVLPELAGSAFEISIPLGITMLPDPFGIIKGIETSHVAFGPFNFSVEIGDLASVTDVIKLKADGEVILQLIPTFVKSSKKKMLSMLERLKKTGLYIGLYTLKAKERTSEINNQLVMLESIIAEVNFKVERAVLREPGDVISQARLKQIKKNAAQESIEKRIKKVKNNKLGKGDLYRDFMFTPIRVGVSGVGSLDGLKLTGETKGMIRNAFGVQGLNYGNIKLGLAWDFTIAAAAAPGTAGLSLLLMAMPLGFTVGGKAEYGSTSVDFDFVMQIGEKIIDDFYFKLAGDVYLRDFVRFALVTNLDVIQLDNTKEKVERFIKKVVPDIKLEDCNFELAPFATEVGAKKVSAKVEGKIGNIEIIPGIGVGGELYADKTSLKIEGHSKNINIPKGKPLLSITGAKSGENPRYFIDLQLPFNFKAGISGKVALNLPKPFGFVSKTDIFLSPLGAHFRDKRKIWGVTTEFEFEGDLRNPKGCFLRAKMNNDELKEALTKFPELMFGASKGLDKTKRENQYHINRLKKEIEELKEKCR